MIDSGKISLSVRKVISLPLIFLILFTSGCWDRKEIDDLAIVGAIGFDKVTVDGRDLYRAIAYIFKPAEMGGGPEGEGGKASSPYWVASALGETLFEAGRNISTKSPRFVFLDNSDFVIIGDRLAREDGVDKVIDLLMRHKDMRLRNLLYIAEGDALECFEKGMPQLESTLVQEIAGMSEKTLSVASKAFVPYVKEFANSLQSTGRDPVAGKLELLPTHDKLSPSTGKEQPQSFVQLTGAAVFQESKLAGWLTDTEVRGFLYVINRARLGIMPLKLSGSQQENFSFEMTKARTKIIPAAQGGNISITLEVKAEGNVGDVEDSVLVSSPEEIKKLEKLVVDNIKQLIENTVHKTQSMEADIFGFGDLIHRRYPKEWNKIEKEWQEIYSDLPVEVRVEARIHRTGMISNPIRIEKEKK